MSVHDFASLMKHNGHQLEITTYGDLPPDGEPDNVAIECLTCNEVLLDYDREPEEDAEAGMSARSLRFQEHHSPGNVWGEWAKHSRQEWQEDVDAGGTSLGYWMWALNQLETYDEPSDEDLWEHADLGLLDVEAPDEPQV